ncbi:DUF58 domain-containing protein [Vibrio sp. RC27]
MELPPYSNGYSLCLEELLHYRVHSRQWLPPAKSLWTSLAGQHQSRQLGRGMDFAEVRKYQAGDDIRSIDWRVTARTGKPYTKLFTEEREKPVVIYVDLSHSMQFGSTLMLKAIQAAHLASLCAWTAVQQNDRVGAVIDLGDQLIELKPQSRQRGVLLMLQKLLEGQRRNLSNRQSVSDSKQHQFIDAMRTMTRIAPKGSDVVLISDFIHYQPTLDPLFTQLRKHNALRVMHISDPLECGETAFRGVELIGDFKSSKWIDFSAKRTRHSIKKSFDSKRDSLESLCEKLQMPYHQISSDTPLLTQLSGKF